jgi:hypothetical protein
MQKAHPDLMTRDQQLISLESPRHREPIEEGQPAVKSITAQESLKQSSRTKRKRAGFSIPMGRSQSFVAALISALRQRLTG